MRLTDPRQEWMNGAWLDRHNCPGPCAHDGWTLVAEDRSELVFAVTVRGGCPCSAILASDRDANHVDNRDSCVRRPSNIAPDPCGAVFLGALTGQHYGTALVAPTCLPERDLIWEVHLRLRADRPEDVALYDAATLVVAAQNVAKWEGPESITTCCMAAYYLAEEEAS